MFHSNVFMRNIWKYLVSRYEILQYRMLLTESYDGPDDSAGTVGPVTVRPVDETWRGGVGGGGRREASGGRGGRGGGDQGRSVVRRDGAARYEISTSVLVSLALVLVLLAVLPTVRVAGVDGAGLVALTGPGAHHVGEGLEGGAGEVLGGDGPYHWLGRAGQRHQGRLDCGRGGRGGRRHQDRLVQAGGEAGRLVGRVGRISLVRRQQGRALHSSRDDRPGRARALHLTVREFDWDWIGRQREHFERF